MVLALGLFAGAAPGLSQCLSPSAAGKTTTTVYRCPGGTQEPRPVEQSPLIVDTGKTTTVDRGPADIPWFAPRTTRTANPIAMPKASGEKKDAAAAKAAPKDAAGAPPAKEEMVDLEPSSGEASEPGKTKPAAAKPEKKTKKKLTKAKRGKAKAVKKSKAKKARSKIAKAGRTKSRTAKAGKTAEEVKTEPAKSDDKVITMTKKDMSLGNRIVNWLGF
ncbi:MAG: hypothetical protein AB7S92_14910 [Parvibaculaceae bacterium]